MKRLWFGEQDISQKRFKKFLKHAGHPTRNGTACKMLTFKDHGVKFYIEHRSSRNHQGATRSFGVQKIIKTFD
jgi:hypothetical protein